jgi:hypothetical protein
MPFFQWLSRFHCRRVLSVWVCLVTSTAKLLPELCTDHTHRCFLWCPVCQSQRCVSQLQNVWLLLITVSSGWCLW